MSRAIGLLSRFSFVVAVAMSAGAIPPPVTYVLTGVYPNIGRPAGGEVVRISGSGFRGPVRVLFGQVEAFPVSVSTTQIDVITPAVLIPDGAQQLVTDLTVIIGDYRIVAPNAFTFRNENLTPRIDTATPNRGSVRGGTRVTLFGDGFQAPVQVLFTGRSTAEARVIDVEFNRVVVEAPPAEAVGLEAGEPADILVRNIHSQTVGVLRAAFRYRPPVTVTAISPSSGPASGGTDLRITGTGFSAPVAVNVAGVPAQVILLSGTEILVRTTPAAVADCQDRSGPVEVTDIASGDFASGPNFTYDVQPIEILDVTPRVAAPGTEIVVTLANAIGPGMTVTLGNASFRTAVFEGKARLVIPSRMTFPEGSTCRPQPLTLDLQIRDDSGCSTVLPAALTVLPPKPEGCALIPRNRP